MGNKAAISKLKAYNKSLSVILKQVDTLKARIEKEILRLEERVAKSERKGALASAKKSSPSLKRRGQKIKIGNYIEQFIDSRKASDNSKSGYRCALKPLADESVKIAFKQLSDLMEQKWNGINPATFKARRAIVGMFFKWLFDEGIILKNPIPRMPRSKRGTGKDK